VNRPFQEDELVKDGKTGWKGFVAGMVGGLVASCAMDQFEAGVLTPGEGAEFACGRCHFP